MRERECINLVNAILLHELIMRSPTNTFRTKNTSRTKKACEMQRLYVLPLHHLTILHHEDLVTVHDGAETMCNDNASAPNHELVKRFLD